ncbi:thioredoxin domain-containing protein, partial [Xanthomonas citri pv. citri]|nr:thioredoxin domain-containing protein [Xanthomonas citri pv. citri]
MADKKATATTSKRAALRAQQEAQESAKKAGVVIIAMVVVAVVFGLNHKSDDVPTTGQITPPSATKDGVYTLNPDKVKAGAPTVTVFQDYQCPACKGAEDALGKPLNELSAEGKIKLEYHTLTF